MSYSEVHRLPIRYRNWFLSRLVKHFQDKNDAWESSRNSNINKKPKDNALEKLSQFESQIKSKSK